jgi:hypothetical protein
MLAAIFLASQLHFLTNKHAVLAGCSAFWPVNCIFLHKKSGHVAPLSGPSVTDLYSVPIRLKYVYTILGILIFKFFSSSYFMPGNARMQL